MFYKWFSQRLSTSFMVYVFFSMNRHEGFDVNRSSNKRACTCACPRSVRAACAGVLVALTCVLMKHGVPFCDYVHFCSVHLPYTTVCRISCNVCTCPCSHLLSFVHAFFVALHSVIYGVRYVQNKRPNLCCQLLRSKPPRPPMFNVVWSFSTST